MTEAWDDPVADGTDFAHPAWWRGEKHATEMLTVRLQKAVNGGDDGSGCFGYPALERLRRGILALRGALEHIVNDKAVRDLCCPGGLWCQDGHNDSCAVGIAERALAAREQQERE